jgi:hypothetical protein
MQFKCDVIGGQQMTCTMTEKDVFCLWGMTVKCGEQGADPVGMVSRHRQNGRCVAGRHGDPCLPIDGMAHEIGWCGRKVQ